jgi:hypothetical protein
MFGERCRTLVGFGLENWVDRCGLEVGVGDGVLERRVYGFGRIGGVLEAHAFFFNGIN